MKHFIKCPECGETIISEILPNSGKLSKVSTIGNATIYYNCKHCGVNGMTMDQQDIDEMQPLAEHPILFSTPMVKAILSKEKNNTRRHTGLNELNKNPDDWQFEWADFALAKPFCLTQKSSLNPKSVEERSFYQARLKCPYGQVGDILWVRETWMDNPNIEIFPEEPIYYKASKSDQFIEEWPGWWKPSIHMKKTNARIWLQITDIKIQRLHDISEEEIIKEGVRIPVNQFGESLLILGGKNCAVDFIPKHDKPNISYTSYEMLFAHWAELWCKVNGRESWDANPWVWAVEFKVISTTGKN